MDANMCAVDNKATAAHCSRHHLDNRMLRNSRDRKVTLGLVVKLMFRVIQQKIRNTVMFFSIIAAKFMCGVISCVFIIFGSMFFATKLIYTPASDKNKKVPIPECLTDPMPKCPHKKVIRPVAIPKPMPKVEPTPIPMPEIEENLKPEKISESQVPEKVQEFIQPIIEPSQKPQEKHRRNKATQTLQRRISNVERFLKESTPEPVIKEKERLNNRTMTGVVYLGCAFVAVQFYVLMLILLNTNIPYGLMFLVICLTVIVGIIAQIVFSITVRQRRELQAAMESNKSLPDGIHTQSTQKIILECEKSGKPVAPVKPFILLKVASTCDLLNNLKKSAMKPDLLKKKL